MQDTLQKPRLNHGALDHWDALDSALTENRLISFRLELPEDHYVLDFGGCETTDHSDLEKDVAQIAAALRSAPQADALDAARVTYEAIICSATQNDTEQDRTLHRRRDRFDALLDDQLSLSIVEPLHFLEDIAKLAAGFLDERPVTIHLFDPVTSGTTPIPYRISFLLDPSLLQGTAAEWLIACDAEEQEVALTCQLHERRGGVRSLTLLRHARTVEGMNSNIVYNHINLAAPEHQAA